MNLRNMRILQLNIQWIHSLSGLILPRTGTEPFEPGAAAA